MSKLFDAGGNEIVDAADQLRMVRAAVGGDVEPIAIKPTSLLDIIQQVADRVDVEKMRALLDMQRQIIADEREIAYKDALTALQGEIPQIERDGRVIVKGVERSRYAKYETIDEYIRPLLAKHGFAISFDEVAASGNVRTFSATLSHRAGHEKTKQKTMPFDQSEYRSGAQSEGSTVSYARRALIKMHLNIVERGEDVDGEKLEPISEDQALDIETQLADLAMSTPRFLVYMGVGDVRSILKRDVQKAMVAFQAQREALEKRKSQ